MGPVPIGKRVLGIVSHGARCPQCKRRLLRPPRPTSVQLESLAGTSGISSTTLHSTFGVEALYGVTNQHQQTRSSGCNLWMHWLRHVSLSLEVEHLSTRKPSKLIIRCF